MEQNRMCWAEQEFGAAQLGDARRTQRLVQIARARAARPATSLPQGCDTRAELKGLYRFTANAQVDREAILASHYQATWGRCEGQAVVLAVQDTTEVDYSHHPATEGLGLLSSQHRQGCYLHTTLAITPERVPLGLLDQQVLYREAGEFGKRHQRKQRPVADKESRKWLVSLERTAQAQAALPGVQLVSVGDREADVYDFFWRAEQLQQPVLIRGSWNRALAHEEGYLWDFIERQAVAGHYQVSVPRQGRRRERQATVAVRYGRVALKAPRHRTRERLPALTVDVVLAREEAPPRGEEALEWLLITTVAVDSLAQAVERVQWYACRWGIEVYHLVLKSGCRIEQRQFEHAAALERYLAIDAVVAWRVMGLTMQGRAQPELPCDVFLELEQWQALVCFKQKTPTPPRQPPSLAQATQWIAELGGYQGRSSGGPPGVRVIWRGLQRLNEIVEAWLIFAPHNPQSRCG